MTKNLLRLAAIAAFCASSWYGFRTSGQRFSDFAGYYTSSRILATTDSIGSAYHDDWFKQKMNSFGIPDSTFIMYVNPPLASLIMLPVSRFDAATAKVVWNILNVILVLVALELLRRLVGISLESTGFPILALVVAGSLPFLRNLQRGQVYVLLLVLLLLFVHGYRSRKPFLASLPLAALLLLKYFGWLFLILFVIERRWKELGITIGFALASLLLGMLFLGMDTYRASFDALWGAMAHSDFANTGLPCLPALFGGLFTFHPVWNPHPVADMSWLGSLLTASSLVLMVAFTFRSTISSSSTNLTRIACLAALSVMFTPLAADHHYLMMALPISVFLFNSNVSFGDKRVLVLSIVLVLVLVGWYPQPEMSALAGGAKVLAFPRLYAAIALWVALLVTGVRTPARANHQV